MLNWAYFPRSAKPTALALQVVAAFGAAYPKINSPANTLPSNDVLSHVAEALHSAGVKSQDFERVVTFFETLYASDRVKLPLKGILILGY